MGVALMQLLLVLGHDVFAVVTVLVAGIGITELLREVVRASTVPELAAAWHSAAQDEFVKVFNATLFISAVSAALTGAAYVGFVVLLSSLNIPTHMLAAAQIFLWIKAFEAFATILSGPILNMYAVTERFGELNFWVSFDRACDVIAAGVICLRADADPARSLVEYGVLSTALRLVGLAVSTFRIAMQEGKIRLRPTSTALRECPRLLHSFGWNGAYVVAMNLHIRFDILLVSAFCDLPYAVAYSIANQFVSYLRQISVGFVSGLDAIAARMLHGGKLRELKAALHSTSNLQAKVLIPLALLVMLIPGPLIRVWILDRSSDLGASFPTIIMLTRMLLVGIVARTLSEPWMAVLAGMGHAKSYSPFVLVGALLNAILVPTLLAVLPKELGWFAPAVVLCAVFTVVHLWIIPRVTASLLATTALDLMRPLVPVIVTSCASALLMSMLNLPVGDNYSVAFYVCVFAALVVANMGLWNLVVSFANATKPRVGDAVNHLEAGQLATPVAAGYTPCRSDAA